MAGISISFLTPIGNYEDITLRALRILKEIDVLICEERKEGFVFCITTRLKSRLKN